MNIVIGVVSILELLIITLSVLFCPLIGKRKLDIMIKRKIFNCTSVFIMGLSVAIILIVLYKLMPLAFGIGGLKYLVENQTMFESIFLTASMFVCIVGFLVSYGLKHSEYISSNT